MELNVCRRAEPSHIHIRRPSREQAVPVEASEQEIQPVIARDADEQASLA
jgi:hypothetical protein